MRFTAVATLRDEGPYIWEWVAYHKCIGFDDIIIYQNDSIDFSIEILRELADINAITYFDNSGLESGTNQKVAYMRSAQQPKYLSADWVMAIDLDEFLVINTPEATLQSLIEAMPEVDNIIINWRRFGSSGHRTIPGGKVLENFTWADHPHATRTGKVGFKSLFRRDRWSYPGIHLPKIFRPPDRMPAFVNGSGLKAGEFETSGHVSGDPLCQKFAQINHYMVRDASSFMIKAAKWATFAPNRPLGIRYWKIHNTNVSNDLSAHRFLGQVDAMMAQLDQESNGALAALTNRSLNKHRSIAAGLAKRSGYMELFKAINRNNDLPVEA